MAEGYKIREPAPPKSACARVGASSEPFELFMSDL
jgi:hypothetical protein